MVTLTYGTLALLWNRNSNLAVCVLRLPTLTLLNITTDERTREILNFQDKITECKSKLNMWLQRTAEIGSSRDGLGPKNGPGLSPLNRPTISLLSWLLGLWNNDCPISAT